MAHIAFYLPNLQASMMSSQHCCLAVLSTVSKAFH